MANAIKIDKPQKIRLKDYDPNEKGKTNKESSEAEIQSLSEEINQLQDLLYAAQTHSVLIVLQAPDTGGKDGTITHVMAAVNPLGCSVASFKVPSTLEASHDFLWRIHQQTPGKGNMTIFNRSHYEDVLVTKVHGLIDEKTCKKRYDHIKNFEAMLADSNTIIMKFYLMISKDEQEKRLKAREADPSKAWKLSAGDWKERELWDKYMGAYEDAIGATAAPNAPWYIIPGNYKWYRNLAIATTIRDTLAAYKGEWEDALKKIGEERLKELKEARAGSDRA
ncbi:polyphosphate kinase [Capsulimonas corticalis]|uniref:Polyphosphate kinase n=1 Tax=Capsulimonas corticalis TaxID=2219043 RepID=A0A402D0Y1_9BACT|nr:PPK2 family polyphosphate kinase [Capsulimonas corticalis]BDI31729.1 polyphosphate kinase [Capsulimonas corticalis]